MLLTLLKPGFPHNMSMDRSLISAVSEPFIDAKKLAEFLGCSARTVLSRAHAGDYPGLKITNGKRCLFRFRLSEVAAALHTGPNGKEPVR